MRRVHETTVALESSKYYIFLCVCVRARVCVWVCMGARAQACSCMRVGLLIQYATYRRHTVCVLSGSAIFFEIISQMARFSEKSY